MNLGICIGRLTRDPEMRFTAAGKPMCRFDVAVSRKFKNQQSGEWVEDTTYIPVVVWDRQAESCDRYLSKGKQVAVNGRMTIRSYEDKNGIKRKVFELVADRVEFLSSRNEGSQGSYGGGYSGMSDGSTQHNFNAPMEETEEDIPF